LGSFRTYVGLLRYNFGAKRPNYLPTQLPSAASGRKTYLPTYLPIPGGRRENTSLPTYLPEVAKSQKKTDELERTTPPTPRHPSGGNAALPREKPRAREKPRQLRYVALHPNEPQILEDSKFHLPSPDMSQGKT